MKAEKINEDVNNDFHRIERVKRDTQKGAADSQKKKRNDAHGGLDSLPQGQEGEIVKDGKGTEIYIENDTKRIGQIKESGSFHKGSFLDEILKL